VISVRTGRVLSALGAVLLGVGLFMTWYHVDRPAAVGRPDLSGWDVFVRLRFVVLGGALLLLVSAFARQVRGLLIGRTVLGVVLFALILRRIIDPPDPQQPIATQAGVFIGLVGAVAAALGGLVDTGREVLQRYPDLAFWRPPVGEIGSGYEPQKPAATAPVRRTGGGGGAYVDSTADEI
jgi:hypothetical protein